MSSVWVSTRSLLPLLLLTCLSSTGCVSTMVDSFTGEDVAKVIRVMGLPAEGTVLEIWETGVRVNDNPVVGFLLEVRAEDREPWEATTKGLISILAIPRIQPGMILPVTYDPNDPSRIALPLGLDGRN